MAAYRWTERDWADWFEERAAIAEYHGELTRKDAERVARDYVMKERLRRMSERSKRTRTDGRGQP